MVLDLMYWVLSPGHGGGLDLRYIWMVLILDMWMVLISDMLISVYWVLSSGHVDGLDLSVQGPVPGYTGGLEFSVQSSLPRTWGWS